MIGQQQRTTVNRSQLILNTVISSVKSPFRPMQRWWIQRSGPAAVGPATAVTAASPAVGKESTIVVSQVQARVPITLLQLHGALDNSSYQSLIVKAQQLYEAGARHIILDMSHVPSLGISSMVALHGIARLLHGQEPLDPAEGWETLRAISRDLKTGGLQQNFKLYNPQPLVERALVRAGFEGFLEIYCDLEAAIASF